jgi:hypothetical protein
MSSYAITSPRDVQYNCIAWAAEDIHNWWWPIGMRPGGIFWPPGVPEEETVEAFVQAFATIGYEEADSADFEEGVEKIALYQSAGEPTHAARQLPDGSWTSKLGDYEDIRHESLSAVEGSNYGTVVVVLGRARETPPAQN